MQPPPREKDSAVLRKQTVFVIGAGAGDGLKMLLGDGLSRRLAEHLDFRTSDEGRVSGHPEIKDALKRVAKQKNIDLNALYRAGRKIAQGVDHAGSIDNFIYAHSDDEHVKIVGKIAIVYAILAAEKDSCLCTEGRHPPAFRDEPGVRQS